MLNVVLFRVPRPPVTDVTVPVSERSSSFSTVQVILKPVPSGLLHVGVRRHDVVVGEGRSRERDEPDDGERGGQHPLNHSARSTGRAACPALLPT